MSDKFIFYHLALADLVLIEQQSYSDHRGKFSRVFCSDELAAIGWSNTIAQINYSVTFKSATIRGLHFQYPPAAETKILSCLRGKVFDVVVDLRRDSPTFLQFHQQILSADDAYSLYIPAGFAHGYQSLSDDSELLYLHSAKYQPLADGGINPFDPILAIDWPLACSEISPRDLSLAKLEVNFLGLTI